MSLAREICAFVAAAYGLGLVLEDLKSACDPSTPQSVRDGLLRRFDTGFDALIQMPDASDIDRKMYPFRGASPREGFTDPSQWHRAATEALSVLQAHVAARVGMNAMDQLHALLVMLLVDQRERGRFALRGAADLAPWLGVEEPDILEMLDARVTRELVSSQNPASMRLTFGGRLSAENLLAGEAEPSRPPAVQPAEDGPSAAPTRIEGAIESLTIENVFSFGSEGKPIPMAPLNLLIGANGAGK
jgi:hypothetical protein